MQCRVGQVVGGNVAPQMVHRDQRLARRVGQALGKVDAHQHGADKPRGKGDGHGTHIVDGHAGVGQGLVHRGTDIFRVTAAGNLGHHAAVERLFLDAGGNDVGNYLAAVLHNGGGGLVAGGFNS